MHKDPNEHSERDRAIEELHKEKVTAEDPTLLIKIALFVLAISVGYLGYLLIKSGIKVLP